MSYICNACGKELGKKDVLLTINKDVYCANTHNCNEHHVNSVKNILERKGAEELYAVDEIDDVLFQRMDFPDEQKEKITKIIKKPQSIRIPTIEMANFLINYIEKFQLGSLSEAVRECIEFAMYNEAITNREAPATTTFSLPDIEPEQTFEPEPEKEPTGIKLDLREPVTVPPDDEVETF